MNSNLYFDILNKFGDDFPTGEFLPDDSKTREVFNYVMELKEDGKETEDMFLGFILALICRLHGAITSYHSEKDSCVKLASSGDVRFHFRILTSVLREKGLSGRHQGAADDGCAHGENLRNLVRNSLTTL
ncbi:hypothetical protein [uncultured Paraglaciecola sp.]|uniref:hypothetical protein n=1 Tax=uncultured Paraglaciecola sp. TaxID=1765024 RepID=UPI0026158359|nr:hypothetical protein [uncultured Paraglaciecola sp.]